MSDKYSIKAALESTETTATVLHAILFTKYGEAFYDWDTITIAMEVSDDYQAEASSETMNRIAALQLLMVNDAFFTRLDAFMGIANTLASGEPFFAVFDPMTVEEAAWGIAEAALNREMQPFSYAIKRFLKVILSEEGYTSEYPDFFDVVFAADKTGDADLIAEQVRVADSNPNTDNINNYIDEQLTDMVYQFDQIPSLADIDDALLASSRSTLVETLGDD